MIVFGHRGVAGHEPENTVRSVAHAISMKLEWTEIDVHAVGELALVIHDRTLDRTTDGKGPIDNFSFDEIRKYNAGKGEKIPLLSEILDVVSGKIKLNIELKGIDPVRVVLREVDDWVKHRGGSYESLLVSSFNHRWLMQVQKERPKLPVAPLLYGVPHDLAQCGVVLGASFLNVDRKSVTPELIQDARHHGQKVIAYTVNDAGEANRLSSMGVDGVFSDYPERIS